MLISKIKYIFFIIIFALRVTNFNANENSYLKYSPSEDALSFTGNSVIKICDTPSSIGLVFLKMKRTNGIKWTAKEKKYLIENYYNTDNIVLAKKLNKTVSSILGISKSLRIFKSDEYISKLRRNSNNNNANKTSTERFNSFLKNAKELHECKFDYSKFKYSNAYTRSIIICPVHGEFIDSPNKHIAKDSRGCKKCWNELHDKSIDMFNLFLIRAYEMHGNKFDYSKFIYISAKTKGTIVCPIHGDFEQTPDKHLSPKSKGCQKCWADIRTEILRHIDRKGNPPMTKEDFLDKCIDKHGNKFFYDLSNYNGITKDKIKITCPIHGEFEQSPTSHLQSETGCHICGKEMASKSMTKSYDNFIEQSKKIHKNKYTYPESNRNIYKNKKSVIKVICEKHGEFDKKAQKHVAGQGCYKCRVEEMIKENILVGGYSEFLFKMKPFLKDKIAFLYYLKINDGEYYKIGITTNKIEYRITGIKNKSKKEIKNIEIVSSGIYNLYDAFKIEQQILSEFKKFRAFTFWSSELFNKNILSKIKKYFHYNIKIKT